MTGPVILSMLTSEAIGLVFRQEQDHDPSIYSISPLRPRMLDDMRKLEPKTLAGYIRAVRRLAAFLKRSPDTATIEDLRRFQLHLVDQGTSPVTLNATITGLKFFFDVTIDRGELMVRMSPVRVPHKLPVVLSREEAEVKAERLEEKIAGSVLTAAAKSR